MQGTRLIDCAALEPMTGCGILGVLKCIAGMDGVLPLIHGPVSCSSGHRLAMLYAGIEPLLPTTSVEQRHVVMGSVGRLADAMRKAWALYHPRLLVVILSCATAMTGDDYDGACAAYERDTGARALVLDGSALAGDEVDACLATYAALERTFHIDHPARSALLALDGLARTDYAFELNQASLKGLIESSLRVRVTPGLFSGGDPLDGDYRRSRKARVSLLWDRGSLASAAPIGVEGSLRFLSWLAEQNGLDLTPDAMALHHIWAERLSPLAARSAAARPRVGVEGAGWYAYAMAAFLKNELGCRVLLAVDRASEAIDWRGVCDEFYEDTGRFELVELLRAFDAQWVLGSSNVQLDGQWRYLPFYQPVWRTVDPVAMLGYEAALSLAQTLVEGVGA